MLASMCFDVSALISMCIVLSILISMFRRFGGLLWYNTDIHRKSCWIEVKPDTHRKRDFGRL